MGPANTILNQQNRNITFSSSSQHEQDAAKKAAALKKKAQLQAPDGSASQASVNSSASTQSQQQAPEAVSQSVTDSLASRVPEETAFGSKPKAKPKETKGGEKFTCSVPCPEPIKKPCSDKK